MHISSKTSKNPPNNKEQGTTTKTKQNSIQLLLDECVLKYYDKR